MAKTLKSVFGTYRSPEPSAPASLAVSELPEALAPESPSPNSRAVIVLGKSLFLKGELSADEDLLLLGRVEGSIKHSQTLTVGIGGTVVGDLTARAVIVKGTVEGDIEASHSVVVTVHAVVNGDIKAPRVSVVEGARFNGSVTMTPLPPAEARADESASGSRQGDRALSAEAIERMLTGG